MDDLIENIKGILNKSTMMSRLRQGNPVQYQVDETIKLIESETKKAVASVLDEIENTMVKSNETLPAYYTFEGFKKTIEEIRQRYGITEGKE